jgi:hypothetical protein
MGGKSMKAGLLMAFKVSLLSNPNPPLSQLQNQITRGLGFWIMMANYLLEADQKSKSIINGQPSGKSILNTFPNFSVSI